MAPMPSCRLEGSRHPMTQRPAPRAQSPFRIAPQDGLLRLIVRASVSLFNASHPPLPIHPLSPSFLSLLAPLSPFPSPFSLITAPLQSSFCYATMVSTKYTSMYQRRGEIGMESKETDGKITNWPYRRRGEIEGATDTKKVNEKTLKNHSKWRMFESSDANGQGCQKGGWKNRKSVGQRETDGHKHS